MPPDRRGASKCQLGDTFAGGQRLARLFAETLHHVQHPGREQIADQLQQQSNTQRRLFRRLEHHAVTRRQGRGQLPRGHQQREVPRDNLPDHPQRFMEMIGHRGFVNLGGASLLSAQAAGEVAKMIHRQRQVGIQGFADRFPIVPALRHRQIFQMLFNTIGDLQQQPGALLH